jgi:branched-chain amino acid transport system permease protein
MKTGLAISSRAIVTAAILTLLALLPPVATWLGQDFYVDVFTRIMIFGLAAVSLDIILGYGGMVSFGHAAYLGIGAYAVGILAFYGIDNGFVQFGVAILASATVALFIGVVSLRTSGVYFIMITLALAQMLYFLSISLDVYGGDNGLNIDRPSHFVRFINLGDGTTLYYVVWAVLVMFLFLAWHLVNARFGMVIRGAKSNERRMEAIGFPILRYRLAAFVIAGAICGVAGALLANQTLFVSPSIMHWTRSGEILMMVILGGMGTLIGPVLGAVVFLVLETGLADLTSHWQAIMGPILVLVVLFGRAGILGFVSRGRVETRHG